jgi:hypothetical protein
MSRHLAAAVLYAVVNLLGPLGVDASVVDWDDDDDAGLECVEYRRESGHARSRVLEVASQSCGQQIDRAWVASDARGSSAAALQQPITDIAVVNLAVVSVGGDATGLAAPVLAGALAHCRDEGALKVVVEAEGMDAQAVRRIVDSRGYQFSRMRGGEDEVARIEFYTDLYRRSAQAS